MAPATKDASSESLTQFLQIPGPGTQVFLLKTQSLDAGTKFLHGLDVDAANVAREQLRRNKSPPACPRAYHPCPMHFAAPVFMQECLYSAEEAHPKISFWGCGRRFT